VAKPVIAIVLVALLSATAAASDPGSGRGMRQIKPRSHERQTGVREDDFVGPIGLAPTTAAQPVHERLIEWAVCPAAQVIRLIERWRSHPPVVVAD
jgi:hypothetical protein